MAWGGTGRQAVFFVAMPHDQSPSPLAPCVAGLVFAMPVEADAFAAMATEAVTYDAAGLTFHEGVVAGRRQRLRGR